MDVIGILIAVGIVGGLILVVPVIALVRASAAAQTAERNQARARELGERVLALEYQVQILQGRLKSQSVAHDLVPQDLHKAPAAHEAPASTEAVAPKPAKAPVLAAGGEAPQVPPLSGPAAPEVVKPPEPIPPPEAAPPAKAPAPVAVPPSAMPLPAPAIAPPHFEVLGQRKPSAQETAKRVLSMEEVFGTDWLNKIGMSILVIGIALLLAYEMRVLGPAGKVLLGWVVSIALLGAGIFYEARERYRVLARAGIGGGWAIAFFTTYAMYHVPAARILHSQLFDLVLLLAVAAVMVVHTLRYNSQVVTGLALLLGFTTVTISKDNVYSLSAGAILALALVIIVQRRRWFELEICGILASYFNHFYWLRPIIEPMGGHRHPFPEFFPSAALLIFYWLVFRASYLLRHIPAVVRPNDVIPTVTPNGVRLEGERRASPPPELHAEEKVSTVAALLNTFLLLALMKYQSVHPEWAFRFLLTVGAVEFVLGQLPITRRRRAAFVVLSVLGATLMVWAIPFKYSGETLPMLWLAEAEALFLAGVFLNEIVFCRLGLLASGLVAFQLNRVALHHIYDPEWKGFHAGELIRGIMEYATTTLIFYGDAHWLARRSSRLAESRLERGTLRVLSYLAGITGLVGIWWLAPEPWVAVGFAALALTLMLLGSRTSIREFVYQAHAVALLAFLRVLMVNFAEPSPHLPVRVATVAITAVLLYACARWSGFVREVTAKYVPSWHSWTASWLVGTLAWHELKPVSVAVAWTLLALALFEIGRARHLSQLRLQAYLAFGASFLRLFFVNFTAAGAPGELSPRFYTTVPVALAFFYVYSVLDAAMCQEEPPGQGATPAPKAISLLEKDRRWKAAEALCFMGTFTLAGWARFELEADWVVAAWAAMIWALAAIAWRYQKRIFLHQGLLLGAAVLMRTTLHNFYERSYFPAPFWQSRRLTVGVTAALLFAVLPLAFRLRRPPDAVPAQRGIWRRLFRALERHPEQVFFFIPVFLLTVLLALEARMGMVTVAWGVEGVAIFLLALLVGQRSYRLSGLGLLLLCVGKIVMHDVWGLHARDRYLTFIVLGAALLGVSYLYARYRETIRQYL